MYSKKLISYSLFYLLLSNKDFLFFSDHIHENLSLLSQVSSYCLGGTNGVKEKNSNYFVGWTVRVRCHEDGGLFCHGRGPLQKNQIDIAK